MPASIVVVKAAELTGAVKGRAITQTEVRIPALSGPQKTALLAFVQSLTQWTGAPGNILTLSVARVDGNLTQISCTVRGLLVHTDGNAALAAINPDTDDMVGVVP